MGTDDGGYLDLGSPTQLVYGATARFKLWKSPLADPVAARVHTNTNFGGLLVMVPEES